jgi:hypothetical protein
MTQKKEKTSIISDVEKVFDKTLLRDKHSQPTWNTRTLSQRDKEHL